MSDTPRNDSTDDNGDDLFGDPTAPTDAPSYGPPSTSGEPEHTERLPSGGDTQHVPTEPSAHPASPAAPRPAGRRCPAEPVRLPRRGCGAAEPLRVPADRTALPQPG